MVYLKLVYYFIRGDVSYLVEGRQYTPTPQSILIMSPNVFQGVKINSEATYERYALHFLPNVLVQFVYVLKFHT